MLFAMSPPSPPHPPVAAGSEHRHTDAAPRLRSDDVVADFTAFLDAAASPWAGIHPAPRPCPTSMACGGRRETRLEDDHRHRTGGSASRPRAAQIFPLYQLSRRFRWEVSFLTTRIPTGDRAVPEPGVWRPRVYMPAVVTVPGLAGEVANALRSIWSSTTSSNCLEVVSSSQTKPS
jgi:hypothetical protein